MVKVALGTNVFMYPMPVTLLGTMIAGKPNFMALGWVSRVNLNPPMVGCGVAKNHYSNRGIAENGTFSINFPSAKMVEKVDYCGLYSGNSTDKSAVFEVFFGEDKTAPLIRDCPLSLECRVIQTIENQSNQPLHRGNRRGICRRGVPDGKPARHQEDKPAPSHDAR